MKILFITYYFPPCSSIASNRTISFFDSLDRAGYSVDLVTRGWGGNENLWSDYVNNSQNIDVQIEQNKNHTIHYLPYQKSRQLFNQKYVLFRKLNTLKNFICGRFSNEVNTFQFYDYCNSLMKENNYSILLTSSPPININKLGYKLTSNYPNLKWIADFRDLQNHILLPKKPQATLIEKIEHFFLDKYLSVWLQKSSRVFVASEPFQKYLKKKKINTSVLLNGFEERLMDLPQELNTENKFIITILGTIYPKQEIQFFLDTLKQFISDKSTRVQLKFIGLNTIPEVAEHFREELGENCLITNKIPRAEAIKIATNSHLLAYIGWKGYKGVYSGKIFEYLALGKNIFITPSDRDVIEQLINKTKSGFCANSIEDGLVYLNSEFKNWETKKYIYHGKTEIIRTYSREFQNKKLINCVKEIGRCKK